MQAEQVNYQPVSFTFILKQGITFKCMKKANHTLLLHPFFIVCLLVLLLNDIVLKYQYHNWLTGKLSDVAGVAAFAIFFTSILPQKKKWVYVLTVVAFAWWKSPLAQPFIGLCHATFYLPVNRVVDYTDYAALLILFLTWGLQPVAAIALYRKLTAFTLGTVSVFAFCATSAYKHVQAEDRRIYIGKDYKTSLTEKAILHRLDSLHIEYKKDSFDIAKVYYRGNYLYTEKDTVADTLKYIYIPNNNVATLYNSNSAPSYITITNFIIDGDTLPKIKLRIRENLAKRNFIKLEDMEVSAKTYETYANAPGNIRDGYIQHIYVSIIRKLH